MLNDKLNRAFDEATCLRYGEFLEVSYKHHFSLSYRLNRKRIIKDSQNNKYSFKTNSSVRLKLIFITVVLSIAALVGFISVAYINGFIFQIYPDHSVVSIRVPDNAKSRITDVFKLSPESGYTLTNESYSDSICSFEYNNGDKIVLLTQSLMDITYNIDTEGASPEEVTFLGNKGFWISKDNKIQIAWTMDGYLFILVANINKDDAESLFKTAKFQNI